MLLFTYGTLMRGNCNHSYMCSSALVGVAVLRDYALYDLGCFPGIRPCAGASVTGELYVLGSQRDFERIRRLEGDGSLYVQHRVTVEMSDRASLPAVVFVYNAPCENDRNAETKSELWRNHYDL